jgi:glucokinase
MEAMTVGQRAWCIFVPPSLQLSDRERQAPIFGGGRDEAFAPAKLSFRAVPDNNGVFNVKVVAGIDLGGTAINYTILALDTGRFLIEGLCEHPALSTQGPDVCLGQIEAGLLIAAGRAGVSLDDIAGVGLDTPGPASASGVLSARGSTNFVHADWAGFDICANLEERIDRPVVYLNDGNAGALWGHFAIFGANSRETSISAVIGTGLGGGVIVGGNVVKGRMGFGGELGHVLIPYQSIEGIEGLKPECNCGRTGDLESLCSLTSIAKTLLPYFLPRFPGHALARMEIKDAAKLVRGLAEKGDPLCREIFRVQACALGLFFDEMVNTFDPDALIVGGGALETGVDFQRWFLSEARRAMPAQREEQAGIPIHVMPNGDTAGARGAAIESLQSITRGAVGGTGR